MTNAHELLRRARVFIDRKHGDKGETCALLADIDAEIASGEEKSLAEQISDARKEMSTWPPEDCK